MYGYELKAVFDSRNSFYGKATVDYTEDGVMQLFSYGTLVAEIDHGVAKVYGVHSDTTLRHIKEFLKQADLMDDTKKQVMEDYGVEV